MLNPIGGLVGIIISFISSLLGLYNFCIFIYIVLSWLFAMDFLYRSKPIFTGKRHRWGDLSNFLGKFIEPLLIKIRRRVPLIAGRVDISPIILMIAVYFADYTVIYIGSKIAVIVGGGYSY